MPSWPPRRSCSPRRELWALGARCRRPAPPPRLGRAAWCPLREPRRLRKEKNGAKLMFVASARAHTAL
eukprot:5031581-Pyramimonas_sp.AAC.1